MLITTFLLFSQLAWAEPSPQPSPQAAPAQAVPALSAAPAPVVPESPPPPLSGSRKLSTPIIPKRNGAIPIPPSKFAPGKRIEATFKNGNPGQVTITPKKTKEPPPRVAGFQLAQSGGKLVLSFQSKDPTLSLSPDRPLAIQLSADEPVEVDPAVVTLENWPKKGAAMNITYKGTPVAQETTVTVHAAYYVCKTATKECKRSRQKFTYPMTP